MPAKAALTNLYSKLVMENGEQYTAVTIETTLPVFYEISYPETDICEVCLAADLIMYPGPLYVNDGIVREIVVKPGDMKISLEIKLSENVKAGIKTYKGIPYRIVLNFNRRSFYSFYKDKVIVIDPGHGGSDGGYRGPVNLLERDMAWKTAMELVQIFEGYGARVVLTRRPEESPDWEERLKKVLPDTLCFISVHEHGADNPEERGTAVMYNPFFPGNEKLAAMVLDNVVNKVKTPRRGIKKDNDLARLGAVPALRLEPVVITNWVDEGMLRNPYFHRKTALAVAISIKQFFMQES